MRKSAIVSAAILALAGMGLTAPVTAGEVKGKVRYLRVRSSDMLHYVEIEGSISGSPACATNAYFMIRDETSEAGKSQFAMLLSALMSGRPVVISGAGTCNRWPDGEDILGVYLSG